MKRAHAAGLAAVLLAVVACSPSSTASFSTGTEDSSAAPSSSSATATASVPSLDPTRTSSPSPSGAILASGAALPACQPAAPAASDTVTFVASGSAWALDPIGAHLTCLFAVADAGPFEWGPLGDRALLGGFEVKGVGEGPSAAARNETFAAITWSRPTGKSIVYAPAPGTSLKKVHLDGTPTQDVTPLGPSTYLSVTYHPSGEAFAFAVDQSDIEASAAASIWISSNTGKSPARLVFSNEGTTFGAMGFDADGRHLFYAAQHADDHPELHSIDVTDLTQAPVVWDGPVGSTILDIQPGLQSGTVAWTSGSSCDDSVAMAQTPAGAMTALPDAGAPTRAVGWLGATRLLAATGPCEGPLDLSAVDVTTGSIAPLVSGVAAAAVRTPVPTPPAPLPKSVPTEGSGFS